MPAVAEMVRRAVKNWLITAVVFLATVTLTLLVWQRQINNQHLLLSQRTEDVCLQAARRLEVFMKSQLSVASIFATRWATHETRDFSRTRFQEFNSVLLQELPGYHAVGLIPPDLGEGWLVSRKASVAEFIIEREYYPILEEARRSGRVSMSAPFESGNGATNVYAVLPLSRGNEYLGYLVVEFNTEALINDCFQEQIRSRYHFVVRDGQHRMFQSSPDSSDEQFAKASTRANVDLKIRNRTWTLDLVPRKEMSEAYGWSASLQLPLFGIFISLGLSWTVYLLLRRLEMFRAARDQQVLLARKTLLAQEEERARVSRELHDELGQVLTALRLELGWLEARVAEMRNEENAVVANIVSLVDQATRELRRMCKGLRPPLLDDLGLEPAVRLLVDEFEVLANVDVELDLGLNEKNSSVHKEIALCAYRILQESLTNISRHARATKVQIELNTNPKELTLRILDDGEGFDMQDLGELRGWGLEGMRERAHLVGGKLRIHSARQQGTEIVFRVPLRAGR